MGDFCAHRDGYGIGSARVKHHLPLSIGESKFRREYSILKLIDEHLFQLYPECMGETHEKVMGHRAWRIIPSMRMAMD